MSHDPSPMLIMSHVDDAGMSPHEFRVMAHICRRAGYKQDHNCHCWSSAPSIAEVTGINVKTVRKAIKNLTENGWLVQQSRIGQSTLLTPATGTPINHLKRGPKSPGTLPKQLPYPNNYPTQTTTGDPTQITGGDPTQTTTPKGIPEGKPLREPSAEQPALLATDDILPFASERFKSAWEAWQQHRKEKRHKLTPSTTIACLKKLHGWGEERAIKAIWHSIENGWQGLFELKESPTPLPPSFEEVAAYAEENNQPYAESFYDYAATNGWRTKTGPIIDWKAAFRQHCQFKEERLTAR